MPSVLRRLSRAIQGAPIATGHARNERLNVLFALPTFASDALSSVAYATESILLVLLVAGSSALQQVVPISLGIALLMAIVAISYRQTIFAYPGGGGSYTVASDNLGPLAGMIAGASLIIGYIMTVAVSEVAGVLAITSAFPDLAPYRIHITAGLTGVIALVNLRGMKESGFAFALPTYSFVLLVGALVVMGIYQVLTGSIHPVPEPSAHLPEQPMSLDWFLWLRAFTAGCAALTGVEAISNGVPAFRAPEAQNAAKTLTAMAVICVFLFIGVSVVTKALHVVPIHEGAIGYQTTLSMIAKGIAGDGLFYYLVQFATMAILVLAANTAFADFPRVTSFLARDGYLPRQLGMMGDRLVFHWGILLLTIISVGLIYLFQGEIHLLLPLYAGSVFIAFSMSQYGMVLRWRRLGKNRGNMMLNLVGALATTIVGLVFLITKFKEGAYLVPIIGAGLVATFIGIRRHYSYHEAQTQPKDFSIPKTPVSTVLVLVPRIHLGVLPAINYARSIGLDCRGIHVSIDPAKVADMKADWARYQFDIPLVILDSPYRTLVDPILEYVDETLRENPDNWLTVIVPEAVPSKWWQSILHNNSAFPIKLALAKRKKVVITNVRYHLT